MKKATTSPLACLCALLLLVLTAMPAETAHAQVAKLGDAPVLETSPKSVFDIHGCPLCTGNIETFTIRYQGGAGATATLSTSTAGVTISPTSVSDGDTFTVTRAGGLPNNFRISVNGSNPGEQIDARCANKPSLGSTFFEGNSNNGVFRIVKLEATAAGGGGSCTLTYDLECDDSLPRQLDVVNETDAGRGTNPLPGDVLKFTATFNNPPTTYESTAENVQITATYDETAFDLVDAGGGTAAAGKIVFNVGNISSPGSAMVMFKLQTEADDEGPETVFAFVSGVRYDDDQDSSPSAAADGEDDTCTVGVVLPVELAVFDARLDGRDALLVWETASETNNAGFEVQHRYIEGGGDFEVMGFVEGHGTTLEAQRYEYRLEDLAPGRHAFRLRQIDFDGTFEYHPTLEVFVEMPESFLISAIYPNPFNPQATLQFAVKRSQQVRVDLYNALGQRIQTLFDGVPPSEVVQDVRIDGSALPSGTYLVRVVGETFQQTQTVTLLK